MQEHILLNNYFLQSMPCLKAFIIPAESCIFKWSGYIQLVWAKCTVPASAEVNFAGGFKRLFDYKIDEQHIQLV